MKIVLSHSYFLKLDSKEAANNKPYPPLAPMYLSALIKSQFKDVQVFFYDVMFDLDVSRLTAFIERIQPDLVLIYDDDFNYLTKMCLENMRQAILKISKNKNTESLFIAHGSDASDQAQLYLEKGFDYIVHKNAEDTVIALIEILLKEENIKSLPGISYLSDNALINNPPQAKQAWIEKIPIADWEAIQLQDYREIWMKNHGYFSLNISTAHGCPYRCNWCAKPLYGRTYKLRPPHMVAEEFAYLKNNLKADHIWVTDDIFALKPQWLEEFAQALIKHEVSIPYKIQARADLMSEEYVNLLKTSGCKEVWLGAESGSQKILDAMDKDQTISDIQQATQLLKKAGIKVAFFLQYGYPGESVREIKATLKMVRKLKPDAIGISVSYPLKGTTFYNNVVSDMKGKTNWQDSDDLALLFTGKYHPDFYRALHKFTHHYFGFISLTRKSSFIKFIRRLAAQVKHIPGMMRYRLAMQRFL